MTDTVRIVEVGPRDGLQNEKTPVGVADRTAFVEALVVALILVAAVALPIEALAEWTARITLTILALVNAALMLIKRAAGADSGPAFRVPKWVPLIGCLLCLLLLATELIARP